MSKPLMDQWEHTRRPRRQLVSKRENITSRVTKQPDYNPVEADSLAADKQLRG